LYFSKFLIEAKQELKKQVIAEKKKAIEQAEESKDDKKAPSVYDDGDEKDYGNDDLSLYATLLLPYWETNASVQPLIQQMLKSNDKKLKYSTTMLLIRNNKPYPDSLLNYFGSLDDYRYKLYIDLKKLKKLDKFPALYNNHLDLGRSALFDKKSSSKPDSLIYLDRMMAKFKGKQGYIYFYKYKTKKTDLNWKLATVGLVPEDSRQFEFENDNINSIPAYDITLFGSYKYNRYDFTSFSDTKLNEDEPITSQLNKALKKILYSRRKSAKEFYEDNEDGDSDRLSFNN